MKENLKNGSSVVVNACASEEVQTRVISHEEIAALAFSYWRERGCQGGTGEEDRLRAERELIATAAKAIPTNWRLALVPILRWRPVKAELSEHVEIPLGTLAQGQAAN